MSKPLIPTSNLPGFEKPLDSETIAKNREYDEKGLNSTPEQTQEMKNKASEIFGSLFSPEKNILDISSIESQDNENPEDVLSQFFEEKNDNNENLEESNKPTSDSPYFPILENLNKSGHISEELFIETVDKINSLSLDESRQELLKVVGSISDSEIRKNVVKSFENENEVTEENFEKTDFFNDFKELNINLDKGIGGLEVMLAQNYISIPDIDGNEDKQKDLLVSMDITTNTILKNNSIDFKNQNGPLISEIKSEKDLDRKYILLKELYKNDLKNDAMHGGDKAKKEINSKKSSLIEEAKKINKIIVETKKNTSETEEVKQKKLEELELKKQEIIKEGKDIDDFGAEVDSLSGGELDKSDNGNDGEKGDEKNEKNIIDKTGRQLYA